MLISFDWTSAIEKVVFSHNIKKYSFMAEPEYLFSIPVFK